MFPICCSPPENSPRDSRLFNNPCGLYHVVPVPETTPETTFAFDVFDQLVGQFPNNNIAFSPLGLRAVLGMALLGARGETADELAHVLQVGSDQDSIHDEMRELIRDIENAPDNATIIMPCSIWLQESCECKADYVDTLSEYYNTSVYYWKPIQDGYPGWNH